MSLNGSSVSKSMLHQKGDAHVCTSPFQIMDKIDYFTIDESKI